MPNVEIDCEALNDLRGAMMIYPQVTYGAMSNALNRTAEKVKVWIVEDVQKEYSVKKNVKKTIGSKKATRKKLEAEVSVTDKRLKLSNFPYKQSTRKSPVMVKVKKGNYVTSNSKPSLFVAKSKVSGKNEVFKRTTGNTKFKIEWGMTLSIPQMVSNDDVYSEIRKKGNEFLPERFQHEFKYMYERKTKSLGV